MSVQFQVLKDIILNAAIRLAGLFHFLRAEPWPPPPKKQARPNR